ncbi:MAG: LuxR C-terminal-related transcriptional regulator [Dysgonamonadaceae bacterium]|jgi:DNA-binding NarL/FixJ family response regulator|nr:LuxR C-terminal-related transcriptional regulator [Dysgonamonadaceae bacterium]
MNCPIRISVFEPSAIIRNGILSALGHINSFDMEVDEVTDPETLKSSLSKQKPNLLIVNPCVLGVLSLIQIRRAVDNPAMKCVAIQTTFYPLFLLKQFDDVISIYDPEEQIIEKLTTLAVETGGDSKVSMLTTREKEIIICVIQGLTNRQIADKLHLSMHTIISHRRNISSKLQIHSTAGLTVYAMVNKLAYL